MNHLSYTIKRRKANWIDHKLRRNCLLKHVIEGKIEVKGRQGRRLFKQKRRYWKLKRKN
jgi:hypothetical protein